MHSDVLANYTLTLVYFLIHCDTTVDIYKKFFSPVQATPRAKLGQKAMKFLKKGKTVEDALLVDIVIEAIR
jgi:adenylate kinase family enzyme